MRIAIDFDNTIVSYETLFAATAISLGYTTGTEHPSKSALRDHLRSLPDGENKWRRVQAIVYGPALAQARPFPGFGEFLTTARSSGAGVFLVSHKSQYASAADDCFDLRVAAQRWLSENGYVGPSGFDETDIYFEPTLRAKIGRIAILGATHVIDDLPEVFADPTFPTAVKQLLFAPGASCDVSHPEAFASWPEIRRRLFHETPFELRPSGLRRGIA